MEIDFQEWSRCAKTHWEETQGPPPASAPPVIVGKQIICKCQATVQTSLFLCHSQPPRPGGAAATALRSSGVEDTFCSRWLTFCRQCALQWKTAKWVTIGFDLFMPQQQQELAGPTSWLASVRATLANYLLRVSRWSNFSNYTSSFLATY